MNIVLFGPPGAGKGTQANNLVKDFNLIKISSVNESKFLSNCEIIDDLDSNIPHDI